MMKILLVVCCGTWLSLTPEVAGLTHKQRLGLTNTNITLMTPTKPMGKVGLDLCPTCVSFAEEVDDIILDVVLNIGIMDSCGVLCTIVEQKTGSQVIGAVCNVLCDVVGIDEFIKMITKADLDPIYFCELTKMCPVFDSGDAQITELFVNPESGPPGKRNIGFTFVSKNGTGTGQININITTVDNFPVSSSFLNQKQPAGTYPGTVQIDAEKSPNCHPQQQPCERWKKGTYTVTVSVCNGECFSGHPHSLVYDRRSVNFTITEQP